MPEHSEVVLLTDLFALVVVVAITTVQRKTQTDTYTLAPQRTFISFVTTAVTEIKFLLLRDLFNGCQDPAGRHGKPMAINDAFTVHTTYQRRRQEGGEGPAAR